MLSATLCIALCLFALFLLLLGDLLHVRGLQALQLLALRLEQTLVPHDHVVELLPRYQDVVEFLECLVLLVHHAEDPEAVALDLLDEVAVEGQDLEGREVLQLADLFQVGDIVAVEVDGLQVGELEKLDVDVLQVVVGEVEPFEVRRAVHNVLERLWKGLEGANLIVIEEEGCADELHFLLSLILGLAIGIIGFAATHSTPNILVCLERNIEVR